MFTMRAIVAELNGKIIAIGGTYRIKKDIFAFAEITDELRARKKDIIRMSRKGLELVRRYPVVFAVANPEEPTAAGYLRKMGFEHLSSTKNGEVFVWHGSHQ